MGFFGSSDGKESACSLGDHGSVSGTGRSPGEESGNPLQYSCLEISMNRGAWRAVVCGVVKSRTRLSDSHTHTHTHTHVLIRCEVFFLLFQDNIENNQNRAENLYWIVRCKFLKGKDTQKMFFSFISLCIHKQTLKTGNIY